MTTSGDGSTRIPRLGWPELIGSMAVLKMKLEQVQPDAYPFRPPRVAATEERLLEAEHRLGHRLDPLYRAFLQHADGWPSFFLDVALLGTEELARGPLWKRGQEGLDVFYAESPVPPGIPPRTEVEPIAVAAHSIDVFAIGTGGPVAEGRHPVLWLAGDEIDRWTGFEDYFRSMYSYLDRALTRRVRSSGGGRRGRRWA